MYCCDTQINRGKARRKKTNKTGKKYIFFFAVFEHTPTKSFFGISQANNMIVLPLEDLGKSDGTVDVEITNSTCVIFGCADPSSPHSSPVISMDEFVCFPPAPGQTLNSSLILRKVMNVMYILRDSSEKKIMCMF